MDRRRVSELINTGWKFILSSMGSLATSWLPTGCELGGSSHPLEIHTRYSLRYLSPLYGSGFVSCSLHSRLDLIHRYCIQRLAIPPDVFNLRAMGLNTPSYLICLRTSTPRIIRSAYQIMNTKGLGYIDLWGVVVSWESHSMKRVQSRNRKGFFCLVRKTPISQAPAHSA